MTKIKQLEQKLRKGIEKVFTAGGFMNDGHIVNVDNYGDFKILTSGCCVVGSVLYGALRDRSQRDYIAEGASKLGVSYDALSQLEAGYRFGTSSLDPSPFSDLGAKLREDYT